METSALRANIPFISSTAARSDLSCRQRSRRACVLPLYQWISLGDGRISEVETAIQGISISDPLEVTRAGVDPFTVWTDQRARMLRTNLYNLLRAAGPTEIRSRCGLPAADAMAGGERRGRRTAAGHRTSRKAVQEERAQDRKAGIIWRKKAATEVMRTARHAVLLQNQKVGSIYIGVLGMKLGAPLSGKGQRMCSLSALKDTCLQPLAPTFCFLTTTPCPYPSPPPLSFGTMTVPNK